MYSPFHSIINEQVLFLWHNQLLLYPIVLGGQVCNNYYQTWNWHEAEGGIESIWMKLMCVLL